MKKIRALIIEDEAPARELIKFMLTDHPEIEIAGECGDGFCGAREIKEKHPDLIFLDIQMPKRTGFELLEVIDEKPEVIFTTAFDQYAIRAFELNAVDYLLKPYSKERFDDALTKADEIEVPIQINGKLRGKITVPAGIDQAALQAAALADDKIKALLEGKTIKKVIVVPGKLVNIVIG